MRGLRCHLVLAGAVTLAAGCGGGSERLVSGSAPGLVLDVHRSVNGDLMADLGVVLRRRDNTKNDQLWKFVPEAGDAVRIEHVASGLVLEAPTAGSPDRDRIGVRLGKDAGEPQQRWGVVPTGERVKLVNRASQGSWVATLDLLHPGEGSTVGLEPDGGREGQRWHRETPDRWPSARQMARALLIGLVSLPVGLAVLVVVPLVTLRAACAICRVAEPPFRRGAAVSVLAIAVCLAIDVGIRVYMEHARSLGILGPEQPPRPAGQIPGAPGAAGTADAGFPLAWFSVFWLVNVVVGGCLYGWLLQARADPAGRRRPIGVIAGVLVAVVQWLIQGLIGAGIILAIALVGVALSR